MFSFSIPSISSEIPSFPQHLLVIDDDVRLRDLLTKYLEEHSFIVSSVQNTREAKTLLESVAFDLIILDIMMPEENGFEFCEHLRHRKDLTPILFLSARGEVDDRLEGFEKGGDDYLSKPFEPKELLFRVKALLRRIHMRAPDLSAHLKHEVRFGEFMFNLESHELMRGEETLTLTEVERKILMLLLSTPREFHSRENLAQAVSFGASPRSIDVQIVRLRRKLEKNPKYPRYLQTMRHKGYVFIP